MVGPMVTKGHFPKKGERKVNGEWVMPTQERQVSTAADRRDYLRKQAGWPVLRSSGR